MNVICRSCLRTNRVRKGERHQLDQCQFCGADMTEAPPAAKAKPSRKDAAPDIVPDPVTSAVAPVTNPGGGGGGFGKIVLIALAIVCILYYQHWSEQRRIERERQLASDRQFMEFLGFGAKAAVQGLFSSPSVPPQHIGPNNPALRSPAPPQRQTTVIYDNQGNRLGEAITTTRP